MFFDVNISDMNRISNFNRNLTHPQPSFREREKDVLKKHQFVSDWQYPKSSLCGENSYTRNMHVLDSQN